MALNIALRKSSDFHGMWNFQFCQKKKETGSCYKHFLQMISEFISQREDKFHYSQEFIA